MPENQRTELSQLGEFGLINRIKAKNVTRRAETIASIGDDAAILNPIGKQVLTSTDMLVEGIHFDLSYTPLQHLGYKAVAVNVSDIAAMNAFPVQITVSIAISNRFSLEAVDMLYEGIFAACQAYNIDLVGGDTTSSNSGLIISVTVLGLADAKQIAHRSGAKPGDAICVTGDLGGAYLGLQVLLREKATYLANPDLQPDLSQYDYLIERQLKPEGRTDFIHELAEFGVVPSSMIDISDGLASELLHICTASGVGASIFERQIPIHDTTMLVAEEFNLSATTCALNGGEDYELLFTVPLADLEKIRHLPAVTPIGLIREKQDGAFFVTEMNEAIALTAQGWVHF